MFEGLDTPEKRVDLLRFEKQLVRAAGYLSRELQEEKHNPLFLSELIELGKVYTTLDPSTTINSEGKPLISFLKKIQDAQDEADVSAGTKDLVGFVQDFQNPSQVLKFTKNLLKAGQQFPLITPVSFPSLPILPRITPPDLSGLYEVYRIFPGDTPRFMRHYYEGGGAPVDLADWGLLDTYRNAPNVSQSAYKLQAEVMDLIDQQPPTVTYMTGELPGLSVDATFVIFAMGHSELKLNYVATIDRSNPDSKRFASVSPGFVSYRYTLELRYSVRDNFIDALDSINKIDGNQELPGNPVPYALTASWNLSYSGWTNPG